MAVSLQPIMADALDRKARTLDDIFADIRREERLVEHFDAEWRRTQSDAASDRGADADDRLSRLRAEAMNMVREMTGVSWSVISAHLN